RPIQNRRSDVIGQVAGDDGAAKTRQVDFQNIRLDDLDPRFGGEAAPQVFGQEGIDLHRDHSGCPLQQLLGEGPASGANFNDEIFRRGAGSRAEAFQDRSFDKEVLSELRAYQAVRSQPITLIWLRRYTSLPLVGRPNSVAGLKRENRIIPPSSGVMLPLVTM